MIGWILAVVGWLLFIWAESVNIKFKRVLRSIAYRKNPHYAITTQDAYQFVRMAQQVLYDTALIYDEGNEYEH